MIIERSHKISDSFRTAAIRGQFDFENESSDHKWDVNIDLPSDWQIGVIVGPSGSGKTTIGKEYFGAENYFTGFEWSDKSVVDDFQDYLDIRDITTALSSVGFSSPPNWLQPYNTLSNGQKFRVEMARVLFDERELIVVDEFTSVVDRTVAQVGSYAIQKYIRKNIKSKKLVLLSCHYDILDWLQPDWIYDVSTGKTERGLLRQRPPIVIDIYKAPRSVWGIFKHHHYLTSSLSSNSKCIVATVNGKLAGFSAYSHSFGHARKRLNRQVILPDYQGLGLGMVMANYLGDMLLKEGHPLSVISSHPALIHAWAKSHTWVMTSYGHKIGMTSYGNEQVKEMAKSALRVTGTFIYVGDQPFRFLKNWKDS